MKLWFMCLKCHGNNWYLFSIGVGFRHSHSMKNCKRNICDAQQKNMKFHLQRPTWWPATVAIFIMDFVKYNISSLSVLKYRWEKILLIRPIGSGTLRVKFPKLCWTLPSWIQQYWNSINSRISKFLIIGHKSKQGLEKITTNLD